MARADVKPINWEPLKWDPQNCEESSKAVSHRIEQMAQQPINWYLDARRSKSRCARGLRMGAILMTALAGLHPLLGQIFGDGAGFFSPAWTSVGLGVAALFVAIDKFFGCSTAWMRFIATEHKIRQRLEEFQLNKEIEVASWQGAPPSPEQVQRLLTVCKTMVAQVHELVQAETNTWIAEFQDALKQLSDVDKPKTAPTDPGGINLSVTNGDQVSGEWTLFVDNGSGTKYKGKTAALANLPAGQHKIGVKGTIAGQDKQAEVVVVVTSGGLVESQVTL